MIGLWIVLTTLAAATVVGLILRSREGRIRTTNSRMTNENNPHPESRPEPAPDSAPEPALPERVARALPAPSSGVEHDVITLVQLSTTFCAPCRHARGVLSTLAGDTAGLRHVDLDITDTPDVALQLGVLRTPTTLALTATGYEVLRVSGVPRIAELRTALREHLPADSQ